MLTILFDGVAYGMLLFVLACGLAVTLGLMNFINLAHGAFAMAGGYITVILMDRLGLSFYLCLPIAFVAAAILGIVLERLLYRHLYNRDPLDQVLFSIGLVFMAISGTSYFMGARQQIVHLPASLQGRWHIVGAEIGIYDVFIIVACALIMIALQLILTRTRFGSQLRAAVDDGRVARGLGIRVNRVFALTFAAGSGLAGLGGALGSEMLTLDPTFPLRFMIYFLIVVTVGGTTSMTGPFVASLILGVADVLGKYYVPGIGAFVIYAVTVVLLLWRPYGLVSREAAR